MNPHLDPEPVNTLTITPDGPLQLQGRIVHAGVDHTRVALCRCGGSANKPFCDGSHRTNGFTDAGLCHARDRDKPAAPQPPTGPVRVDPITDGPLMLEGWVEIRAADGSALIVGDKCWLCRCGHSAAKPFCDGTHKKVGFTT